MKEFTNVTILPSVSFTKLAPAPGARRILGDFLPDGGYHHLGWLMPQVFDSRQQPRSLAFKLREELNAKS